VEDRCLSVFVDSEVQYRISVDSFDIASAFGHQWDIDNRNRIVHSRSGMCLTLDSSATLLHGKETKTWVKLQKCSEMKGEGGKWSFESILNGGDNKCASSYIDKFKW